jgi:hypothetical protein
VDAPVAIRVTPSLKVNVLSISTRLLCLLIAKKPIHRVNVWLATTDIILIQIIAVLRSPNYVRRGMIMVSV